MTGGTRVVLHLGAHKTATSLIQKFLRDRPNELARMRAAHVSRSATNDLIGWGSAPRKEPERLRQAVLAAADAPVVLTRAGRLTLGRQLRIPLGRPRTVIVSHENALGRPFHPDLPGLYPAARTCADGLRSALRNLDLRIVYYLRSQEGFLESYYLQTVHQGGTQTFEEWLGRIDLEGISWVPVVASLVETFGQDHVVVRDFDEIREGQEAYLRRFLQLCDPTADPRISYQARRNVSVSEQGLQMALAVNPLLRTDRERKLMRTFLQANFSNATGPRPVLLGDERAAAVRQHYATENAELVRRHGALPPG